MTTTVTNQQVNDISTILSKGNHTDEEKIKISIAFGELLAKQNFDDPTDYYDFVREFEIYITSNLL